MNARLAGFACASLIAVLCPAAPAFAGPPYETDDPEPTETGHWEIYAFTSLEGRGANVDGTAGLDLNYGPVKGVQLTATLPIDYAHVKSAGWHSGAGDLELGVKYRFLDAPSQGVSMAVFPRVILPTSKASSRTRLLLPLWAQKDVGKTSIFGGGGIEINPGPGNRNFWLAGAAVTHAVSDRFSLGGEVTHQSADAVDARSATSLGLGTIIGLGDPFSLLLSGGPTWTGGQTNFHAYTALAINL
ncbi:MAG TPA: hypothetical protein VK485_02255 [Sphingomicrobium sp.]|nr:hypothetical protein [Sphingomicrobium sp.]